MREFSTSVTCSSKTSLLLRFVSDTFDPDQAATIGEMEEFFSRILPTAVRALLTALSPLSVAGVDFKVKTIVLDQKRVKLSIWVSGGCGYMCLTLTLATFSGYGWAGTVSYFDP